MKAQMIKLLIIIAILFIQENCLSQMSTDMIKYWYYRNRLKYFVVPGNKIGESQIVGVRNRIAQVDADGSNNPNDPGRTNVDYGQHGKYTGLYIGVLATEYYLLKENGQTDDAANTFDELYNALYVVKKYWDSLAEPFWTGYSADYDGFFIRGNVPCDFLNPSASDGVTVNGEKHIDILNKGLSLSDTFESQYPFKFGDLPRGHPAYVDHRTSAACNGNYYSSQTPCEFNGHPESMSQDEAIGILMGLALTAKLADGACQTLAKEMADKIIEYITNLLWQNGPLRWFIFEPPWGNPVNAGKCTWTYGSPLLKSGYQITGYYTYPLSQTLYITPAQKIAWLSISTTGIGDNDLEAILMALSNYYYSNSAARIASITTNDRDWDTFYILLWEVLHDKRRKSNNQEDLLEKTITQLDPAPCEGPYNYGSSYYAGGGWASTYRWFKKTDDQNGAEWYTGNYNGTDYMLLYNLCHYIARDTAPFYVSYIDKNLVGTVNAPTNFVAFNSITSTQTVNSSSPTVNYKAGDHIHFLSLTLKTIISLTDSELYFCLSPYKIM